jgi:dimethylargininase
MIAGIALAAGGRLLIIAAQWDSFGESSQQWRVSVRPRGQVRERPVNGTVLIRAPSSRLAEGIVTHIRRTPVDVSLARAQHAAYADALAACGWMIAQVPAAEDCPDSVFVEDAVVVCEDLAAPARRAEVPGVAGLLRSMGLRTAWIEEPGTLDGGDVLQAGHTVYVGRGGRTNGAGIRQLRALLAPLGRTVIAVPLSNVLHLKSAVTALPDGTFLLLPQLVPAGLFPAVRPVDEESGCHVVPLGADRVLIAASAPRTAELLDDLGFTPVVADIGEFEKLEGCVTCLSVLLPGQ